MSEKIIVTEEQEKVIDKVINSERLSQTSTDIDLTCLIRIRNITKLDILTIARIVEGEPFEVKREFKEGDIVKNPKDNTLYRIVEEDDGVEIDIATVQYANSLDCVLVCKAENREDLKEASE